jgi:hypothetical protein
MAENTYEVVKSDDGKILSVQADKVITDPNSPDAVQVLADPVGNALAPSEAEQVVSTRDDGTVSVGGNTEQPWGTGNPVTRVDVTDPGKDAKSGGSQKSSAKK